LDRTRKAPITLTNNDIKIVFSKGFLEKKNIAFGIGSSQLTEVLTIGL
tara:strand:- start:445 stop:588 length:144 start_codon:yes stop_codon:yes gene_type:complete